MPIHPSFDVIRQKFISQYGKDGVTKYYAWLESRGLDDTKPLDDQRSKLAETFIVSEAKIDNKRNIKGIAAYPGASRNRRWYLPEELIRADGLTVPVFWDHDYHKDPIGQARFTWDKELELLRYEADILPNAPLASFVSIGAGYDYLDRYGEYTIPRGLNFYELSLTHNPGFPLTTAIAERKLFVEHVGEQGWVRRGAELDHESRVMVTQTSSGSPREGVTLGVKPEGEVERMSEEKKGEEKGTKVEEKPQIQENKEQGDKEDDDDKSNSWSMEPEQFAKIVKEAVASGVRVALAAQKPSPAATTQKAPIGDSGDGREKRLYESMADLIRRYAAEGSQSQSLGMSFRIPAHVLPLGLDERIKWAQDLQKKLNKVTETLATTTTGSSLGVYGISPAIVIPADLYANLMDTVNFVRIPRGADRARWATIKVAAAGALAENTEPTEVTQTLTAPDAVASPRGLQQSISYELERKMVADVLEAVAESFRLSYLQDIDNLVATEGNTGVPSGNTLFGDESVSSEASVTSSMTLAPARIATAIQKITTKGYAPDNLVYVCNPVQFDALLKHADVRQAHIFGEKVQVTGVIPALYGVEVRRSTKLTTGTGSASITTYRSFVYKKGVSFGVGASEDLLVETFRDIRKNQTVIKASWDMAVKTLEADSLVRIITA